ncbi:MAG: right-handed parallel beta-helix repeat-containing protein, partial [Candidatus Heimdallarchaeota archaeon]|nr:right-handed parallel beta-helix repeat-containing protein [Candidatus Heimdallarchaeota archaeon]MCK4878324.1 right-handed parallel beta-helix repeat-containing protein [Candidatus Heimdallarchaeota archaeon]
MKINRKTLLGILLGVVIVLSTFVTLYVVLRPKDRLIEHEPIIIWGDEDFSLFDFPGDGSIENPYLIQNYNITTNGKYSIFIRNTQKHFVIRNCYLNAEDYSIYLENIADGSAIITNNICADSENGIFISNSDFIIIANNTCTNNVGPIGSGIVISDSSYCNITDNFCTAYKYYGIWLEETSFCYLFNNTCTDNLGLQGAGINVFHSDNSRLVNNTCSSNERYGIKISVSSYSLLVNNTCVENDRIGILLISSPYSTITNNICLRNKNWFKQESHGINLRYSPYCNLSRNTIGTNIGNGIFLEGSSDCIITANLIYNHTGYSDRLYSKYSTTLGHAVYCYLSSNTTILFNQGFNNYGSCWVESSQNIIISSNLWTQSKNYTIEVYDGSNCSILYNSLDANKEGIHLTDTVSTKVTYNLIQTTELYGLSIFGTSSDNLIHHNSFIDNNNGGTSQAYDEGISNLWFDNVS